MSHFENNTRSSTTMVEGCSASTRVWHFHNVIGYEDKLETQVFHHRRAEIGSGEGRRGRGCILYSVAVRLGKKGCVCPVTLEVAYFSPL